MVSYSFSLRLTCPGDVVEGTFTAVAAITLQVGHLPAPFPVRLDPAELTRRRGPGGH